jgi:hypothetical protein
MREAPVKKLFGASLLLVISALTASACALDATQGAGGSSGPSGSVGTHCSCPNGGTECDGANGGCQTGLICAKGDVTDTDAICTQPCPCPLNLVCKAVGQLGGRLLCFPK